LEASRLHLVSPGDDRADAFNQPSEINQLDDAWSYDSGNDRRELVAAFELIRANEYCTLVTNACCRLVIERFSNTAKFDDRIRKTVGALDDLQRYRSALEYYKLPTQGEIAGSYGRGPCPDDWGVFLDI